MYKTINAHRERNRNIAINALAGISQAKLARQYAISKSRINQIIWSVCFEAWPEHIEQFLNHDSRNIKLLLPNKRLLVRRISEL